MANGYGEHSKRLKRNSTSYLIRRYYKLNPSFKRIARAELKKRHVARKDLPYTIPKRGRRMAGNHGDPFLRGFGSNLPRIRF